MPSFPLIQAALNGAHPAGDPALPTTIAALVADAVACVAAGAGAIHLHPRDETGAESLAPDVINATARAVKTAAGVPVGVSTGAWIVPDLAARLAMIRQWRAPDYASVNLSEPGALDVMRALIAAGVGIEAGIGDPAEVDLLAASDLAASPAIVRVLVEPSGETLTDDASAAATLAAIHAALDAHQIPAPRLQHTDGPHAWFAVRDALAHGLATRIGREDTATLPDGTPAGNLALVQAAFALRSEAAGISGCTGTPWRQCR